jgi:hypothetical protein
MGRWVGALMVAAMAAGCSADRTSDQESDSGVVLTPGDACFASTGGAPVPECEIELCPPAAMSVARTSGQWECDGYDPPGACNPHLQYQAYRFSDDVVWVELVFGPEIVNNYSDATFKSLFQHGFVQLQSIGAAPTDHSTFKFMSESFTGFAAPDGLSYQDGRLRLVLHLDAASGYQDVVSSEPGCCIGDMCYRCSCDYTGFSYPLSLEIDVPVQE